MSDSDFEALVSAAALAAFDAMNNYSGRLWLYYQPSNGSIYGRLGIFSEDERASGYEVAEPQHIPGDRTREQLRMWILDRARRLPVLPTVLPVTAPWRVLVRY